MTITLQAARINAGLRQQDVAEIIGVSVGTIANWERGRRFPNNAEVAMMANIYGISSSDIFLNKNITLSDTQEAV